MKLRQLETLTALGVVLFLWITFSFFVPPFDLDETLYLRVAEEMKKSGHFFQPTFDTLPFLHKPPFFYQWIATVSQWIEPQRETISLWIARSTGLVASFLFLFLLGARGFLILNTSFISFFTLFALIFDPIQSALILAAFLSLEKILESTARKNEIFKFATFTTLATLWKGLNAALILIGPLAISVWYLTVRKKMTWKDFSRMSITGITTLIFIGIGMFILWKLCGDAFMHEFFWVQHFARSSQPLESHGGFWGYYLVEILLFASPLLILSKPLKWNLAMGSFVMSTLILFSVSATKLPHYIWPIFPILALFASRQRETELGQKISWVFWVSPFTFGTFLITAGLLPDWSILLRSVQTSNVAQLYLETLPNFQTWERTFLIFTGAFTLGSFYFFRKWDRKFLILGLTLNSILILLTITTTLLPKVKHVMIDPFEQVGQFLKAYPWEKETCIRWHGPQSPTLSRALGLSVTHNRCDDFVNRIEVRVTPKWKRPPCEDLPFKTIYENQILRVCRPIH